MDPPDEIKGLMEELATSGTSEEDRSASAASRTESIPLQQPIDKAPSDEVSGLRPRQRRVSDPSRRHQSAPGDPTAWLQRADFSSRPSNELSFHNSGGSSSRHRSSPHNSRDSPNVLRGPPRNPFSGNQRPLDLATPFGGGTAQGTDHKYSPSPSRLSSGGRSLSGLSRRSGEGGASLDHLASDSTGGMTASQDGMRSPIVQDEVVDAVQGARSKLANIAVSQSLGAVPNSLASYDQSHGRYAGLQRHIHGSQLHHVGGQLTYLAS